MKSLGGHSLRLPIPHAVGYFAGLIGIVLFGLAVFDLSLDLGVVSAFGRQFSFLNHETNWLALLAVNCGLIWLAVVLLNRYAESLQVMTDAYLDKARLLDLSAVAIIVRDQTGKITYWNKAAQGIYGWEASEAIGQPAHELLQTVFSRPMSQIDNDLWSHGLWEGELNQRTKDGKAIVTMGRWALESPGKPGIFRILECQTDITNRKKTEEELARSQLLFRRIAETTPELLYIYDYKIKTNIFVNQSIRRILGYSPEEFQTFSRDQLKAIIHPDDIGKLDMSVFLDLNFGDDGVIEREYRTRHKDGTYRWLVGSSRVDLQACKLEYSIVSPK